MQYQVTFEIIYHIIIGSFLNVRYVFVNIFRGSVEIGYQYVCKLEQFVGVFY